MTKLRIGKVQPSYAEAMLDVAKSKGSFKKNGLDVELVQFKGDVLIMRALTAGEVQVAELGSFPFINAVTKGADARAILSSMAQLTYQLTASKGHQ
jgi:ABC-type nitrate/sulfonate/bicarbonate transport system substrate-binding protein